MERRTKVQADGGGGGRDGTAAGEGPGLDLLGMDLDTLADVSHPVLSALVGDLRARVAGSASAGLWGFDNDSPPPPGD